MNLFIDIETIPSERARERLVSGVHPPATMTKPDTIAKWEAECRAEAEESAFRRGSLDACFGEIICVGFAINDDPSECLIRGPDEPETLMLHQFAEIVSAPCFGTGYTIVGHNAIQFDVPWLWRRWIVNGITPPLYWPSPSTQPWKCDVFDTSAEWSGFRNRVSLDNLCFALGIDAKGDVDGSNVYDLYLAGEIDTIKDYCKRDVEKLRDVYRLLALGRM